MVQLKAITTHGAIIGAVLISLRNAKRLKQSEVADAVGVSASTWSRIEKGESSLSSDQLRLAAKALGEKPSTILQMAEDAEVEVVKQGINIDPAAKPQWLGSGTAMAAGAVAGGFLPMVGSLLGGVIGVAVQKLLSEDADNKKGQGK